MTGEPLLSALVCGLTAAAGASVLPRLIAALPEPAPADASNQQPAADVPRVAGEEAVATAPPVGTKVPYAEIGAAPWLGARLAVAAGLVAAALGASRGWQADLPVWVFLAVLGVGLGYIDWRTRLLPSRLVAPAYGVVGALVGIAAAMTWSSGGADRLITAVVCWLVVFAAYFLLWFVYPRGLGYGDVRLSGVLGMALGYLGVGPTVVGMYAGFLLGAVIGGVLALAGVVDRRGYPFGPFMLAGAFLGVLHADGTLLFWR
jgi:leader peptidase (prepilin peptidase)/N-methyltransferase